jgi:hypothetical protein
LNVILNVPRVSLKKTRAGLEQLQIEPPKLQTDHPSVNTKDLIIQNDPTRLQIEAPWFQIKSLDT